MKSPWRRQRVIPFTEVKSCDYTNAWGYRIHTHSHGKVVMTVFMTNIGPLLNKLPCRTPQYPPPGFRG